MTLRDDLANKPGIALLIGYIAAHQARVTRFDVERYDTKIEQLETYRIMYQEINDWSGGELAIQIPPDSEDDFSTFAFRFGIARASGWKSGWK